MLSHQAVMGQSCGGHGPGAATSHPALQRPRAPIPYPPCTGTGSAGSDRTGKPQRQAAQGFHPFIKAPAVPLSG